MPESSSLILTSRHERAHREHGQSHMRIHQNIHKKRQEAAQATTVVVENSVVTVVAATVSYVQLIDVDSTGSTFAIETVLANSTGGILATTTSDSEASITSSLTPTSTTADSSQVTGLSADSSQSLLSSLSTTSAPTSTLSIPTSFSSLLVSSNSTTTPLISSSSSFSGSFTNSSTSSTSSQSSLTYLTSSSSSSESSTSSSSSSGSSSSSSYSFSSTASSQPTATNAGGFVGGESPVASSTPSSTTTSGGNTTNSTTPAPVVVGSVVGSIAGLAIIVMLLLFIVKWRRRKNMLSLGSGNEGTGAESTRDAPPSQPSGGMTQRRSVAFAVPAALASLTGYANKRSSKNTERTISSTAGSERGFYRVSGRKLPSVLQSGGDGYGGGITEANTMSGSSFYRDSNGFYGGTGTPNSPSGAHAGPSMERDSGVPVMRPSPARTPVTEHGPFGGFPMPPPTLTPPRRPGPDVLGRSHPSQDGSHASKFTEEV
ncbi:hypothetical protein B0J14DRAFT_646225 [Halenospora varia]|nr:hypothetical protein B0J14DRAFT_646225 [Halenospora varia]